MYSVASLRKLVQSTVAVAGKVNPVRACHDAPMQPRLSQAARAMTPMHHNVLKFQTASTSSWRNFCSKDLASEKSRSEKEPDLIQSSLQRATNPERALQLIGQHYSVMNNSQILSAFLVLHDLVDHKGCDPRDISFSPDFKALCSRALKRIRFFDVTDAVSLLKVAVRLQLPAPSPLVQGICQIIRSNLNHMSLSQLTFVDFLLSQQKSKSVFTDALRMAIPLVFQAQCSMQLDSSDFNSNLRHFYFAVSRRLDSVTISSLAKSLLPHATRLSVDQSVNVVLTACFDHSNFRSIESLNELVETCLHSVATNVSSLPDRTLRAILSAGSKGLFSKPLYDALWSVAIQQQWPLWQLSMLVDSCIFHEYLKTRDLRYLQEVISQNQAALRSDSRLSLFTLSRAFALLPISTDDVAATRNTAQQLAACDEKIAQMKANPMIYLGFVHALCQMGLFPKNQIETVLCSNFFEQLQLKVGLRSRDKCLRQLLEVDHIVQNQIKGNSNWSKLCMEDKIRDMARVSQLKLAVTFPPLVRSIQSALGGNQFLRTQIFSPTGLLMDMCVVMRQGEYPVAVCPSTSAGSNDTANAPGNLKDLDIPVDSKIVGIIISDRSSYLRHTGQMKRRLVNQIEGLTAEGICPVVLEINKWKSLLEHERLPFIMRNVKEAIQQGQVYPHMTFESVTSPSAVSPECETISSDPDQTTDANQSAADDSERTYRKKV